MQGKLCPPLAHRVFSSEPALSEFAWGGRVERGPRRMNAGSLTIRGQAKRLFRAANESLATSIDSFKAANPSIAASIDSFTHVSEVTSIQSSGPFMVAIESIAAIVDSFGAASR